MGRIKSEAKLYETFECDACGTCVDVEGKIDRDDRYLHQGDIEKIDANNLYEIEKRGWKRLSIGANEAIFCPNCVAHGVIHIAIGKSIPAVHLIMGEERYRAYLAGVPVEDILA